MLDFKKGLWANDAPTPAEVLLASLQTSIAVSAPVTLAYLTAEAEIINEKGCELVKWCAAV